MTSFVPGTKLVIYDKSGAWHKTCHKCKIWCQDPNFRKYFSVKEGFLDLFVE